MKKKVRLAGIAYESLVNGPGMRRVFFAQGCKHNCEGCFNQETHDFNGGEEFDAKELVEGVIENPMLKGVTFSGGDPLEQPEAFSYMAKELKKKGIDIWVYTGYKLESILEKSKEDKYLKELLENIDVLVDGRFEESLKVEGLKFRGSSNQRLIDIKKTLNKGKLILIDYENHLLN